MSTTAAVLPESTANQWDNAMYAFLAERQRRSGLGPRRTGLLRDAAPLLRWLREDPDGFTSQQVFVWAYGKGLSGKTLSSTTIGARIACLSSYYRFLIRMKMIQANPCDALERPKRGRARPGA